jgi:DNA-binding CsgD family transcriptional regulator
MTERLQRHPNDGTDTLRALVDRARFAGLAADVGNEIIGSWRRSAVAGLRPETLEVPYHGDIDDRSRLAWAAGPVIRRIGEDLSGSRVGLLLTDERGLVIDRQAPDHGTIGWLDRIHLAPGFAYSEDSVGTNAIGTALHRHAPTVVKGEEHFAYAFTPTACAAMPVTDPGTGRVLGVVDLSCLVGEANALMLPLVKRIAREIEQRLLADRDSSERLLLRRFRHAARTTELPLVAISRRSLLANAAASSLVDGVDPQVWWELVERSMVDDRARFGVLTLPGGVPVTWRRHPVVDGTDVVGALLTVDAAPDESARTSRTGRTSGRDFGWESLTETELVVATQISRGMTNKEAAARLFVSPHTIDFHLRQLFRKLDVRSRVELTRVVLERQSLLDD